MAAGSTVSGGRLVVRRGARLTVGGSVGWWFRLCVLRDAGHLLARGQQQQQTKCRRQEAGKAAYGAQRGRRRGAARPTVSSRHTRPGSCAARAAVGCSVRMGEATEHSPSTPGRPVQIPICATVLREWSSAAQSRCSRQIIGADFTRPLCMCLSAVGWRRAAPGIRQPLRARETHMAHSAATQGRHLAEIGGPDPPTSQNSQRHTEERAPRPPLLSLDEAVRISPAINCHNNTRTGLSPWADTACRRLRLRVGKGRSHRSGPTP